MSKKKSNKKQRNAQEQQEEHDRKYGAVMVAMYYLFEVEKAERKREEAKHKSQRVILWISLIGSIILIGFSLVTNISFDFSWMADASSWYNELYISLTIYVYLTGIVLFCERKLKLDQKASFGYIWPFIGFFISLFLSKTMTATIMVGAFNNIAGIVLIGMLLGYFIIETSVKLGKAKGQEYVDKLTKAQTIIDDNPEIVKEVVKDYEDYLKETEPEKVTEKSNV